MNTEKNNSKKRTQGQSTKVELVQQLTRFSVRLDLLHLELNYDKAQLPSILDPNCYDFILVKYAFFNT